MLKISKKKKMNNRNWKKRFQEPNLGRGGLSKIIAFCASIFEKKVTDISCMLLFCINERNKVVIYIPSGASSLEAILRHEGPAKQIPTTGPEGT